MANKKRAAWITVVLAIVAGCQRGSDPAPAALSGCSKDSDCKGDRVCVAGACADAAGHPATSSSALEPSATAEAPARPAARPRAPAPKADEAQEPHSSPFADFQLNPGGFLTASDIQYENKGIINSYRQLSQFTIINRASVNAQNISGEVSWIDENGSAVGTLPFSTTGIVPAGGSQTFSKGAKTLTSGVLQTKALTAKIHFSHADIAE